MQSGRSTTTLLRPVAALYGAIMRIRNLLYDRGLMESWQAPIPVVSVGNITAGGTGKTPLVDWIVKFYHASGKKTAIISRGYGRRTKGVQVVSDGKRILLGSRDAGDETSMLAAKNPQSIVIVAERRKEAVMLLMREFAGNLPDVIVLDDAYQHRKIARDLDIVVINAGEPFTGAAMLPEGHLREPLHGLRRADLIILNKITDERRAETIIQALKKSGKPVIKSKIRAGRLEPAVVAGPENGAVRAFAFAGIGAPSGFIHTLNQAGIDVAAWKFFRDHETYTSASLKKILTESASKGLLPVTTEKDWFRMQDEPVLMEMLAAAGCRYLTIEPELIEGRLLLEARLLETAAPHR
jgi:tetraacyldisaccharide 4'-kinase